MIDLFDNGPDIVLKAHTFSAAECAPIFEQLKEEISWRQNIMRFGTWKVLAPRLMAWHGDEGKTPSTCA